MRSSPSIVPDALDRDVYFVLDDFGERLGRSWRETDEADKDRATLIRQLLEGQDCPAEGDRMIDMDRPTKITFAEMRDMGIRGLLIYCADYRCSHSIAISGDSWPDDARLSDIEARWT
jgi:hypothetical protein